MASPSAARFLEAGKEFMTPVPLALLQRTLRGTAGQLTGFLTLFGAKDGCNKYVELAFYTFYMLVCRE